MLSRKRCFRHSPRRRIQIARAHKKMQQRQQSFVLSELLIN